MNPESSLRTGNTVYIDTQRIFLLIFFISSSSVQLPLLIPWSSDETLSSVRVIPFE